MFPCFVSNTNAEATVLMILGVPVALLGIPWPVQGLGTVQIGPVLCVADCEPTTGRSLLWSVVGTVALHVGIVTVWIGQRRGNR